MRSRLGFSYLDDDFAKDFTNCGSKIDLINTPYYSRIPALTEPAFNVDLEKKIKDIPILDKGQFILPKVDPRTPAEKTTNPDLFDKPELIREITEISQYIYCVGMDQHLRSILWIEKDTDPDAKCHNNDGSQDFHWKMLIPALKRSKPYNTHSFTQTDFIEQKVMFYVKTTNYGDERFCAYQIFDMLFFMKKKGLSPPKGMSEFVSAIHEFRLFAKLGVQPICPVLTNEERVDLHRLSGKIPDPEIARILEEKGVERSEIARLLGLDEEPVQEPVEQIPEVIQEQTPEPETVEQIPDPEPVPEEPIDSDIVVVAEQEEPDLVIITRDDYFASIQNQMVVSS